VIAFNDSLRMTLPGEVPRMQGVLYKWTNFATGYKARYFILENGKCKKVICTRMIIIDI
jgi:hypothetical protein